MQLNARVFSTICLMILGTACLHGCKPAGDPLPAGFQLNGTWIATVSGDQIKIKIDDGDMDLYLSSEQVLPVMLLYEVKNQSNPMVLSLGTPSKDLGTIEFDCISPTKIRANKQFSGNYQNPFLKDGTMELTRQE